MMSEFRENILVTFAYYDIFDFPLKASEMLELLVNFKHLGSLQPSQLSADSGQPANITLADIQKKLDQLILDGVIGLREDYYFLFNREYLAPLRLKREKIAKRKWQITKRAIWWLRLVPYARAIFASGSLAMSNTDELSDLDVLIVVKHGRIWLARFLILGILSLLGIRRRGTDRIAPDKICANHFITDKSLCIPFKSIYTAQTYANLVPILISDRELIEDFKKANGWTLDYVHSWNIGSIEVKPQARVAEWFLEISGLGHFFNKIAGQYQSERIAKNPVTTKTGGRVIFTDDQLEFHPHSVETQIINSYNERLIKINLPQFAVEKDSGLT